MSIDQEEDHQSKKAIHSLVAHFLQSNNYHKTLKQFEEEHGKPINPEPLHSSESLEEIIKDRINFNELSSALEDVVDVNKELSFDLQSIITHQIDNWPTPYPSQSEILKNVHGLIINSSYDKVNGLLFLSTNDSKFIVVDYATNEIIGEFVTLIARVVIKKIITLDANHVLLIGIDGKINYFKYTFKDKKIDFELIASHQAHKRFVVDVKHITINSQIYLISLGWDFYVRAFKLNDRDFELISEIKLASQGTCFDIVYYQDQLVIVLGKNENTLLDVLTLQDFKTLSLKYKISLNDAEFSSSSFSPRCLTIQTPTSSLIPLIAVGTSHEPYMRLIIVSLKEINSDTSVSLVKRNQIIKNLNTLSPQDKYSQSLISWRKLTNVDKSVGVWIAGDDGIIRGIDLIHDRVIVELSGHKGKIKDFNNVIDEDDNEILITGGVERDVKLWKVKI
ncbi:hypothetical protein DFJ63DRAFT_139484 [Scheffersomyces coipomensis]|uniref:uncharacterized protein n=1 Tax=Scheffersomyces coipomensis TaxID=1788519 RepID=UPI00315CE11C